MKKIKYILIAAAMLPILNACNFLDVVPDNVATIDYVFRDRNTAESYLYTCYSFMPAHQNGQGNPGTTFTDEFANNKLYYNINQTMTESGNNTTNPQLNFWDGAKSMFTGIRCCNLFLEQIGNIPDITPDEALRWKAEAKFLKAYYHWHLFSLYGPIPIVDKNLPINATVEEMRVYREPVDKVVDFIVSTIDEALPDLPMEVFGRELTELGRITRPAAMAIKARVLVTAASPLFNGNQDYSSFKDNRGTYLFPTGEPKIEKWQRAVIACKEAIDTCESVGLGLYTFVVPVGVIMNDSVRLGVQSGMILGETNTNNEAIWLQTNTKAGQNYSVPSKLFFGSTASSTTNWVQPNEVFSAESPSLNAAEMFYSNHGVPIEEDKTYPYDSRFTLDAQYLTRTDHKNWVKQGYQTAVFNLYREPRYYGSLAFDGGNWYGFGITDQNAQYFAKYANAGLGRNSISGMNIKKFVPYKVSLSGLQIAGQTWTIAYYPYSFPVMRMADLYLLYAEALNESDPTNTEILSNVNRIRTRAGLQDVVTSWTNYSNQPLKYTTQAGMRDIIQRERMIELAFEGPGGLDRRRWKIMDRLLAGGQIKGFTWNALSAADFAKPMTLWTTDFQFKSYLWPIKTSNLQVNPNLVQNPGW
ncbi:MAG: RagB/SusD family nutrient uptake outer membrane protein [Bacteroidia bacterium]|nr:RagB/SusD family nutrient uptake outer membrane protein [Bacteroidia bacterium]